MAAYPIITPDSAAVEITTNSSSLTYQMLLNTLTFMSYKVNEVYMEASTFAQGGTQFEYISVKSTGEKNISNFSNHADLYQYLPVFLKDVRDEDIVLDNMSVVAFYINPGDYVKMNFWCDSVSFNDQLGDRLMSDKPALILVQEPQKKGIGNGVKTIFALGILGLIIFYLIKEKE